MDESQNAGLQEINEELYKRNLELAVVIKTLTLLRKLYQISLQSLDLKALSGKVSEGIRVDLNMEVVGIFLFHAGKDFLEPLSYSRSERMEVSLGEDSEVFNHATIKNASQQRTYKTLLIEKTPVITTDPVDVWGSIVPESHIDAVAKSSHLNTMLLYPMMANDKVLGVLLFGLNRSYEILNKFEKDSITSFIDVVSVAIDKALLYEELSNANEQLKSLDKARAEFISIASHQLRTPPATIKWYLAAILSGDYGNLDAGVKETIEKAQVTNNGLISLIDDLLNASRIERGKMEFLFEPADISPIIKLAVDQLIPQAKIKKLVLSYEPPVKPLSPIMADKEKLRQVFNNMIDNAIKYTPSGSVAVNVFEKDDQVFVTVKDTGKGISKDQIASVFDKYNRGKDSAMHATGLGLGMYVAKVVIDQHKGKIWAESEGEGQGSTFIVSIPVHSGVAQSTEFDLTK